MMHVRSFSLSILILNASKKKENRIQIIIISICIFTMMIITVNINMIGIAHKGYDDIHLPLITCVCYVRPIFVDRISLAVVHR